MRSLRRSVSEDFELIGAPKRMAKPKKMSLKAAGRRASVMGYETEGLDTIAEGVPKTKKDGPKKMAKPGCRNSVERRIHRSVDLSAGMASGGDEAMAAAAAVDGPKKIAKPGRRRNSVELARRSSMDLSAGMVGSEVDAMTAATAEEDTYTSIYPANSRMTKSLDGNILKSQVLCPRRRSADIDDIERNFPSDVFVPAERRRNVFISPFLSQHDQASEIKTVMRLMGDEPDAPGVRFWRKIPDATVDSSNPLQNWHIDDVDSSNPEPDI